MKLSHKRKSNESESSSSTIPMKNSKIMDSFKNCSDKCAKTTADGLVTNYIVCSGVSLNTVNHPEFKKLVNGLSKLKTEVHCLTDKTLHNKIDEKYRKMVYNITEEMKKAKYVSTTSDIWSSFRRSYMGVTSHWLDEHTFERKSAALACKRFQGSHDFKSICILLNKIHNFFELDIQKIAYGITDNGKNFVKAFREYKYQPSMVHLENDEVISEGDEIIFSDVDSILNSEGTSNHSSELDIEMNLPPHHKCCSHTLSLCCTTDISNATKRLVNFGRLYHKSMGKLSALWNLTNRSANKASEIYFTIIGRAPITPVITRWNSQYDSINEILKHVNHFPELFKALSLPIIQDVEIEFLKEFQLCLAPYAIGLDKLQGDQNMHIGDIIPSIYAIYHKLNDLVEGKKLKYCHELCVYLINESLKHRFKSIFELNEDASVYILATVLLPKWKLKWVPLNKMDYIKSMFINEAKNFVQNNSIPSFNKINENVINTITESDREFYNFINFDENPAMKINSDNGELQALQYLADNEIEIKSLHKFPIIKLLCLKYNSGIPSSAPVERLFSFSGMILTPQRSCLSDKRFEECTLLKANKNYY